VNYYPTVGRLIAAWASLMALSIATMGAGQVTLASTLGFGWMVVVLLIAWAKSGVILNSYLNLRTAPVWRDALMVLIAVVLAIVLSLLALGGRTDAA